MKIFSETDRQSPYPMLPAGLDGQFAAGDFWAQAMRGVAQLRQTIGQCRDYPFLSGTAIFLGLGIVLELAMPNQGDPAKAAPKLQAMANAQTIGAALPTKSDVDSWVSASVARPLFTPGRSTQAVQAAAAAPPPALPRLAGVMISSHEKIAIFCDPGGSPQIATEGTHLGLFEVLSIGTYGVTLRGPDGTRKLQIGYDSNPSARNFAIIAAMKPNDGTGDNVVRPISAF